MDTLEKWMVHFQGAMEWEGVRFHRIIQNVPKI